MSCTVLVDLAWGDCGKGKAIDYLADKLDVVCRMQGGSNAGHSIYHNGAKIVLRLIPSGIFNEHVKCIMAQGMVIDPFVLSREILNLRHKKINLENRLFISNKAHIVTAKHLSDDAINSERIGTTKKGIGPAYVDKVNRTGLMMYELINSTDKDLIWLRSIAGNQEAAVELLDAIEVIKPFVTDTTYLVNELISSGKKVLFECAQGTLLDNSFGTYPYVTSSNSIAGGACTGAGVGPNKISRIIGVTKAYFTRVGEGPFPTELTGHLGERIREAGDEYGSVTKRPRRVGWFDIPLTKYAAMVNGVDSLVLTKLDILSGLDKIKICIGYECGNVPYDLLQCGELKYIELDGWNEDISSITDYEDLPPNAKAYIEFIEKAIDVPIKLISVGPKRDQIIDRSKYVEKLNNRHMGPAKIKTAAEVAVNPPFLDF